MNKEVINDLWVRAKEKGYQNTEEDFTLLLQNNQEVIDDNFSYVKSKGYTGGMENFKSLITPETLKKKVVTTTTAYPLGQENTSTTLVTGNPNQEQGTPSVSLGSIEYKQSTIKNIGERPNETTINPITEKPYNINNMMEASSLKKIQQDWDKENAKNTMGTDLSVEQQSGVEKIKEERQKDKELASKENLQSRIEKAEKIQSDIEKDALSKIRPTKESTNPATGKVYGDDLIGEKELLRDQLLFDQQQDIEKIQSTKYDYLTPELFTQYEGSVAEFLNAREDLNKNFLFEETGFNPLNNSDFIKVSTVDKDGLKNGMREYTFEVDIDEGAEKNIDKLKVFLDRNRRASLEDRSRAQQEIVGITGQVVPSQRARLKQNMLEIDPLLGPTVTDATQVVLPPVTVPEWQLSLGKQDELLNARRVILSETATKEDELKAKANIDKIKEKFKLTTRDNYSVEQFQEDLTNAENTLMATSGSNAAALTNEINSSISTALNDNALQLKDVQKRNEQLSKDQESILLKVKNGEQVSESDIAKLEFDAAVLERDTEDLTMSDSELNVLMKNIEDNAADIALINEREGSKSGIITNNLIGGGGTFLRMLGADRTLVDKIVREASDPSTKNEYEKSGERTFTDKLLATLSNMAGIIIPSVLTGPMSAYVSAAGFMAQAKYQLRDEMDDNPDFNYMSDSKKEFISNIYGGVVGLLERYGLSKMISKSPLSKRATLVILRDVLQNLPKTVTTKTMTKAIQATTKRLVANGGIQLLAAGGTEASTEVAQGGFEMGLKEVVNSMEGADLFKQDLSGQAIFENLFEAGALGFVAGGVTQGASQAASITKQGFKNSGLSEMISNSVLSLNRSKEFRSTMSNYFKTKILQGEITREEALESLQAYDVMMGRASKIPSNIENITGAFDLITERANIESEIEGKDPALIVKQKERIKEINSELGALTEKAPVAEEVTETKEDTEKKPGDKDNVSGVDIVYPTDKESEERKVERTKPEYVDEAANKNEQEDVEKLKGELEGEFGILTGENPLGQPLTEQENTQLNEKAEAWLKGRGYTPRKVTGKYGQAENSFIVPNLTKEDAIAFAKEFNQESVAHSEGLVYQDGSMNPRVKTDDNFDMSEYTPESDFVSVVNTPEGLKTFSIGYDFETKTDPAPTVEAAPKVEAKPTVKAKNTEKQKTKIRKQVDRAKRSVRSVLKNVEFIVHESDADFVKATGSSDSGAFQRIGGKVKIHVNMDKANNRTVGHEVFHALLLSGGITDSQARKITGSMLASVRKVASPEMLAKLDKFAADYPEKLYNEESIAELFGIISENYSELNDSGKSAIKEWLAKLVKALKLDKIINVNSSILEASNDEVIEFLDSVAKKVATGQEIVEGDLEVVTPSKTNSNGNLKPPSETSKNNLKKRKQKIISEVKDKVIPGNTVSTYLPEKEGVHSSKDYVVSISSFEDIASKDNRAKDQYVKVAKEVLSYGISKTKNADNFEDAKKVISEFKEIVKLNLKWLYDSVGKDIRDISKLWYDGANKIANDLSKKYNYTTEQVSGVMAVLSPQMDWFRNSSLGERVIDIYKNNQDSLFDEKMIKFVNTKTTGTGKSKKPLFKDKKETISRVKNKKLSQLNAKDQSYFIRVYDEVYNSRDYNNITPNGEVNGLVRVKSGKPGKVGWGDFSTIEKAISILEDGTIENISTNLGNQHKVRNFFNNISNPNDKLAVTIDTHAVAAGLLKPLSGKSRQVAYNFGGSSSVSTGMTGTYPVYADAYRELASELGILPREIQSITWEAGRGLFKAVFKADKDNKLKIDNVWNKYESGSISLKEAQSNISELAGGISTPVWYEYLADENIESLDENSAALDQSALDEEVPGDVTRKQKVFRAGDLTVKAEPISKFQVTLRGTGHFGTGFYFFGKRTDAETYAKRTGTKTSSRIVSEVDLDDYNLAKATLSLHKSLKKINDRVGEVYVFDIEDIARETGVPIKERQENPYEEFLVRNRREYEALISKYGEAKTIEMSDKANNISLLKGPYEDIANDINKKLKNKDNKDTRSTLVMKALGFEGVNATGTDLDNSIYGTVVYDIKPQKDITRQQKFTPEEVYADAGLSKSEAKKWKEENRKNLKMPYPEEALKANKDYRDGNITYEERNEIIEREFPIEPLESVPKLPTIKEVVLSLDSNKLQKGIIGLNRFIEEGMRVMSRLDIPAYLNFGIYVETLHAKGMGAIGYGRTAVLKDVVFSSSAKAALTVAATADLKSRPKDAKDRVPGEEYKQPKAPFATMDGAYVNESSESVVKRAEAALKSDEWVQVGFNPYKHAFFYDKANSRPVESATEIIQVGALVMAKGVKYGKPLEFTDKSGDIVRFQKDNDPLLEGNRPTIKEIIRANPDSSVLDVNKELVRVGYSKDQIQKYREKEEGVYNPKTGSIKVDAIIKSANSFRKRMLSARKNLPKSFFKFFEHREGNIAYNLKLAERLAKAYNKELKKHKGNKNDLTNDFDAYLRGRRYSRVNKKGETKYFKNEVENSTQIVLPEEIQDIAISMRNHVDVLSQSLIDSGLLDSLSAKNIEGNIGEYLTTAYKMYKVENWESLVDEQVMQSARNYIEKQSKSLIQFRANRDGETYEQAAKKFIDAQIKIILQKGEKSDFRPVKTGVGQDKSILKRKKKIDPAIQNLMGIYTEPSLSYVETIVRVSNLSAQHNYLTSLRKSGEGVLLFKEPQGDFTYEINTATEKDKRNEAMAPLNGMYTTKEIYNDLKNITDSKDLPWSLKIYMKAVGLVKYNKTILSPATHGKNILGNLGFMFVNGHLNPKYWVGAFNTIVRDATTLSENEYTEKMDEYIKAGVTGQSANLQEIKIMLKEASKEDGFEEALLNKLSKKSLSIPGYLKKKRKKALGFFEKAYQNEDDFFKIIAYESEKARHLKVVAYEENKKVSELTDKEIERAKDMAAEKVKNTLPTYSRVPYIIQQIRRSPLVGSFVAFHVESFRTAVNTAKYTSQELTSGNPELIKIGGSRLLGLGAYLSSRAAIYSAYSWGAGAGIGLIGGLFDDEEERQVQRDIAYLLPSYSKNSSLVVTSMSPGKFSYVDASAADPHGAQARMVNAFFRNGGGMDGVIAAGSAFLEPLVSSEILTGAIFALKNNEDVYGRDIYDETDSWDSPQFMWDVSIFMFKVVEAGAITSGRRIYKSDDPKSEIIGAFTGYREREVDILRPGYFKAKEISKDFMDSDDRYRIAARAYTRAYIKNINGEKLNKKEQEEFDVEKVKELYITASEKQFSYVEDAIEFRNVMERLGAKREKIQQLLIDAGVSKKKATVVDIKIDPDLYFEISNENTAGYRFLKQVDNIPPEIMFNVYELFPDKKPKTNKE